MTFSPLAADASAARVGGGHSLGSRGGQTFNLPPSTVTAPKAAAPIERSMTSFGTRAPAVARPVIMAVPSRFGGYGAVLAGGLAGAALFALLWSAVSAGSVSDIGPIMQIALIAGAAWLLLTFGRGPKKPALARGPSGSPTAAARNMLERFRQTLASNGGFAAGGGPSALAIGSADYDRFEELLQDIQRAYGRDNSFALGAMTTPEMFSYASQDLAENAKTGVRNELSGVNLLQGDLSEAWHETGSDYATMAMRYDLIPVVAQQGSGRATSGVRIASEEVTELWTFRRDDRDPEQGWQLSAIQQVESEPPPRRLDSDGWLAAN